TSTISRFVESGVERDEAEELAAMQREALERAASNPALDTLAAADAEDELTEALEKVGVPEPWRLAEPLVRAGVDAAWVGRVQERHDHHPHARRARLRRRGGLRRRARHPRGASRADIRAVLHHQGRR